MGIQRRDFLKWSAAQTLVLAAATPSPAQVRKEPTVRQTPSILQGATDDTKTQFSIFHDRKDTFQFFVTNSRGHVFKPDEVRPIVFQDHPEKISKVFFSGLQPRELFYLHIQDERTQKIVDVREFSTLDLSLKSLKFALLSCMKDKHHEPEIWNDIAVKKADILFFIGDAVYADNGAPSDTGADPAWLWQRFSEARKTLEIYYAKKLTPVFATWDDHDFGLNNGNCRNYRYAKESAWNFQQFFAQEESHCRLLKKGPGISSALQFNEQLFFLLDNRSFREKDGSAARYAHWGEAQEAWMLELMRQTSGPTWIMTGTQIFPSFPMKGSVSRNHPAQYQGLLQELKTTSSKVVFVSGDVHYTEISTIDAPEIGYRSYELTSSSIHSKNVPGVPGVIPNKRRLPGTGVGERNYIVVESMAKGFGCVFTATCYGADGTPQFRKLLEV